MHAEQVEMFQTAAEGEIKFQRNFYYDGCSRLNRDAALIRLSSTEDGAARGSPSMNQELSRCGC